MASFLRNFATILLRPASSLDNTTKYQLRLLVWIADLALVPAVPEQDRQHYLHASCEASQQFFGALLLPWTIQQIPTTISCMDRRPRSCSRCTQTRSTTIYLQASCDASQHFLAHSSFLGYRHKYHVRPLVWIDNPFSSPPCPNKNRQQHLSYDHIATKLSVPNKRSKDAYVCPVALPPEVPYAPLPFSVLPSRPSQGSATLSLPPTNSATDDSPMAPALLQPLLSKASRTAQTFDHRRSQQTLRDVMHRLQAATTCP